MKIKKIDKIIDKNEYRMKSKINLELDVSEENPNSKIRGNYSNCDCLLDENIKEEE
jgi:hypothetical protein